MLVNVYKFLIGPLSPKYIIEVINSWPLLIMIAIIFFRKNIISFLNKLLDIQKLKIKGVEIDFITDLDKINSDIKNETENQSTNIMDSPEYAFDLPWYEEIRSVIEYSPSYAILLTWNELENEISVCYNQNKLNKSDANSSPLNINKKINYIYSNKIISKKMMRNIFKLRDLRNSVVHSDLQKIKITDFDAYYYLDVTAEIIIYLKSLKFDDE
ncbi:hypothetical protein ACIJDO_000087 [Enterococcus hirae]